MKDNSAPAPNQIWTLFPFRYNGVGTLEYHLSERCPSVESEPLFYGDTRDLLHLQSRLRLKSVLKDSAQPQNPLEYL